MHRRLEIWGIEGFPILTGPCDLPREIVAALGRARLPLDHGDVLVVTHKIVSKAEGRVVELGEIEPSPQARELAARTEKDARLVEVILGETEEILRAERGHLIVEQRAGYICANAGVDRSNSGGLGRVALLPEDPDRSAREIRERIREDLGKELAVLISDTHGRPWRNGAIGLCIGLAGMEPLLDLRGNSDLFGYKMTSSIECVADELAAAATLVMGQCDEGIPLALIKGLAFAPKTGSARQILRAKEKDLFR
ncbi:MAG: coenzyme F420-0:L-glutamate ligase [Candidatus Acetothermia bacterium]|nr:coenzyme F420-0:L-glutamate ligase [Candidatus Acetothermia bacterium]MDH7505125.1 coenzyme F420-0:L-glutamate ligase [Candidatus Acetothermia bacterium]